MPLPRIAITMGDAAGVGPEIIMKSLAHSEVYERCRPLVIGDAERLKAAGKIIGSGLGVRGIEIDNDAGYRAGSVDCIDLKLIPRDLPWGELSATAGDAAYQFIRVATELAIAGKVEAICT